MKLKLLLITIALLLGSVGMYGQSIYSNTIQGTNPNLLNPFGLGAMFNPNITSLGIGRSTGILTSDANDRYNAREWTTSTELDTSEYFEITLTLNAGYEIDFVSFVYTSQRNGNGPRFFAFRSSLDYDTNIGTATETGTTILLTAAAYQNIAAAITFGFYGWNASNRNGQFSINDFTFNGTVTQTTIASDYFRSRASGAWATANNWESSPDNSNWITATLAPTSVANTITIRNAHTITISGAVTADQITVESGGILALNDANLTLNDGAGADLTINNDGTFDNGGENQIIRSGTPSIIINGRFITRDSDGFVGTNTAIPTITPTLNIGSTIEYGLNGNQTVQGSTAPNYSNVTFSGIGTKTLASTNAVTGTVTIKDAAILDVDNKSFGGTGTNLTMSGTSEFRTAGTGVKPDIGGTYTLGVGTKITFTNNAGSLESIRLAPNYYNIDVVGSSVGTNTLATAIKIQNGGTFTVKSIGTFKHSNTTGFSGSTNTAISNTNNPTINLEAGSTIEYAGTNQSITLVPVTTAYSNLTVAGTGTKTIPTQLFLGNNLLVNVATLRIESGKALTVTNKVDVNSTAEMIIENNGSLAQVNDEAVNTGTIRYERTTPPVRNTDYTYWSSPVAGYTLGGVSKNLTRAEKYYSYNSAIDDYKQESAATIMLGGIGYLIRGPESGTIATFDAFFTGIPNNGVLPINGIMAGKSYLLGNPYPSALDAETFLNANAGVLNGTLYFWTHNTNIQLYTAIIATGGTPGTGVYAYTSDDYATYNATGGVAAMQRDIDPLTGQPYPGPAPSGSLTPSGKIASGQGFFASSKTTLSGTTIIYNNSMRVGVGLITGDNTQFFKTRNPKTKTAAVEKHRIWLNFRNAQGVFQQTLIGYLTDATNQFDNRFDGISYDANKFADFYSINQDANLVIQGRALPFDENDEVPLGFRTAIDGVFTINIDQTDGVLTNQSVYIEDKLSNTVFDLRSGPYTFTTKSGTFKDRFVLRYKNKTLRTGGLETLKNQVLVSNKNKEIKVNSSIEIIDKVTIYDLLGKQLFKKEKVNNNELAIPNLVSSQQTIAVKVSLQNGHTVTRKIIY